MTVVLTARSSDRVHMMRAATTLLAVLFAGAPAFADPGSVLQQRDDVVPLPQVQPPTGTKTVSVLILSGEEAGLALSEVYAAARRAMERHTPHDVAPLDAIGLADRETAIRECAGRPACFVEKVRGISQSDLLLTVSVDRLDDGLLLGLRLVDVKSRNEIGATGDEIPAGMSLNGAMEDKLAGVFPASVWDQIGSVEVETEPSNAVVTIGGRSCAGACNLQRLAPGRYQVSARKDGFETWSGEVTVNAEQTARLVATLQEPGGGGVLSSPWFWGIVAAAVAGAAVTSAVVVTRSSGPDVVCIAQTREICENQ